MMATKSERTTFSADQRARILGDIAKSRAEVLQLGKVVNAAERGHAEEALKAYEACRGTLLQRIEDYEAGLPRPALSRCPFTGAEVHHSIDTFGLDGVWWDYQAAARPLEDLPATFFALTGAVALPAKVPVTPFVCKPGPGAPFVVPRLLVDPAVKGVISTIKIGGMTAWPVVYFAEDTPFDLVRINDWGRDYYMAETAHGEGYAYSTYDYFIDYDFELEFYIRTGRLLWIEPGDDRLRLNSTVNDCPYLGIAGRQYPVGMHNGKMWNSLIDAEAVTAAEETP